MHQIPVNDGFIAVIGVIITGPWGKVEAAADFFIKQSIKNRFFYIRVKAKGKFTYITCTFITF